MSEASSSDYSSDYERVARAIRFIAARVEERPSLDEVAAHLGLSRYHTQRLFSRWTGVSPKTFLQILTVERAKELLRGAMPEGANVEGNGSAPTRLTTPGRGTPPVLEVAAALGLSGGSRLYDHFVQLEAVTPGEYGRRGAGIAITYAVHATPFGAACVALTPRGICRLAFLEGQDLDGHLAEIRKAWPRAELAEDREGTAPVVRAIFRHRGADDRPLSLHVAGTNFQVSVWRALLAIPPGSLSSYSRIAQTVGRPGASRAVGQAVGANPIALVIPCHRVIRETGALGGYRWGETRKHAIHAWESARHG